MTLKYSKWPLNIPAFSILRPSNITQSGIFGLKTNHLAALGTEFQIGPIWKPKVVIAHAQIQCDQTCLGKVKQKNVPKNHPGSSLWSQFSAIFANFRRKKTGVFSKINVMINFFQKLAVVCAKKCQFFGKNIFKIITSVPDIEPNLGHFYLYNELIIDYNWSDISSF
jgi:hypothetical protein